MKTHLILLNLDITYFLLNVSQLISCVINEFSSISIDIFDKLQYLFSIELSDRYIIKISKVISNNKSRKLKIFFITT